jgi:hypothetical protein
MDNQIVPVSFLPAQNEWAMMKDIASMIASANGLTVNKMASILLTGRSLGLSIPASLELVQSVQGKTSLAPRGALAMVQGSPLIENVTITRLADKNTFIGYECTIKRKNGFEYTSRWTMENAKAAGLVKPGSGWVNYPENMCLWRAVGFACDVAASDITCGLTAFMKMPEQFGIQLTEAGDIVEGKIIDPPMVDPVTTEIERLTMVYGADAFMVACDGNIPTTPEECEAVATKLEQWAEQYKNETYEKP